MDTSVQIHEAYSVLRNPEKRKAYERSQPGRQVRRVPGITPSSEPEPLIPESGPVDLGEISPIHSFETFSPSFDEIFDWLWDNFSSVNPIKSSRVQNLTIEVPITREQATRGGTATIMVPAQTICRTCRGYGHIVTMNAINVQAKVLFQVRCHYLSDFLKV